jgi:DNA replication protein DnaC
LVGRTYTDTYPGPSRSPALSLEIIDDRQGAPLITSQFPVDQWHELIADATVADAILDRLIHNAYRFELKGESLRKRPDKKPPSD